jgi:hypothetical protein
LTINNNYLNGAMNLVTCTNQEMSDITFKNNTGQYPSGSCITAASFSEIKLA